MKPTRKILLIVSLIIALTSCIQTTVDKAAAKLGQVINPAPNVNVSARAGNQSDETANPGLSMARSADGGINWTRGTIDTGRQADSQYVLYLPAVFGPGQQEQEVPTLVILALEARKTISLPAEIHYLVTGFPVGGQTGGHMHAYVGDPESSFQIEIPLEAQAGIAILPDDKRLPGKKDLTFQLAGPNHELVPNPEAKVTIRELVIEGRR